jgi:hypothetical protein
MRPLPKGGLAASVYRKGDRKFRSPGHLYKRLAFEGLEPYDGKLSRTVLRGERGREAPDLPGKKGRAVMTLPFVD